MIAEFRCQTQQNFTDTRITNNMKRHRLKRLKQSVASLFNKNQEARLLENHYRALHYILKQEYPNTFSGISKETMIEILHDTVYLDRYLRRNREGNQNKLKQKLAREFKKTL